MNVCLPEAISGHNEFSRDEAYGHCLELGTAAYAFIVSGFVYPTNGIIV